MKTIVKNCKTCGDEFTVTTTGKGRPPRYCSKFCRDQRRVTPSTQKTCVMCERPFEARNKGRSTCSSECKRLRLKQKARQRRLAQSTWKEESRKCIVCEQAFIATHPNNKTCSKECRRKWQNQRSMETRANGTPKPCSACGKVFKAHPSKGMECCSIRCRIFLLSTRTITKNMRECDRCGVMLTATIYRNQKGLCTPCKKESKETTELDRLRRHVESLFGACTDCGVRFRYVKNKSRARCSDCRLARQRDQKRKHSKEAKHRRRARKKGSSTVERFTSLELFNRDGWKCQLCGCRVRKYKVMNHPREATIDHIIPLSRGGKHALVNCQTACRQCNSIKGAKTIGQMRFV